MRSSPGSVRVWSSVPGAATTISPLPSPSRSPAAATTPPKPPRRSVPFQWYSSPPLADERTQAPPTFAPPALLAGLWGTRHHEPPHAPADPCVGRRDDHVREPIARDVRDRHHPVAEESVRPLAVPRADQRTAGTRPYGGVPVLERLLLELEAGPGGDVRLAIAVDVERLAEAEPQLTPGDAPGDAPRHAPARTGSGAWRDGSRGARERHARNREAGEEGGGGRYRERASSACACRRRHVLH